MREILQEIAERAARLPHGEHSAHTYSLGICPEACRLLESMGATKITCVYEESGGWAMDRYEWATPTVTFHASNIRDKITAEERAALEKAPVPKPRARATTVVW